MAVVHNRPDSLTDNALARRVHADADEAAFAELYRRHFAEIYDFAARTAGDRDIASEVTQMTFVKVWRALRDGKELQNVRAWLFAVARNATIDELRHRKRAVATDDVEAGGGRPLPYATPAVERLADPGSDLHERELAELVWTAAAALSPQDYSLLDMHVRRELSADEIASVLGLRKGAVYTRLSRCKDALEDAVRTTLLVRRSPGDCAALDGVLEGVQLRPLSRDARRRVEAHARACPRCGERRRIVEVFAGLAPVPALAGVADEIWANVLAAASSPADAAAASTDRIDGADPASSVRRRRARRAIAGALVLLLASAGALALPRHSSAPVRDPIDVRSTSHRTDVPSTDPTIAMVWTPVSGASGYSIVFTPSARTLPDRRVDVDGGASSTVSVALPPGRWWFHLRTRGAGGRWTSTVHRGPYVIVAGRSGPGAAIRVRQPHVNRASAGARSAADGRHDGSASEPASALDTGTRRRANSAPPPVPSEEHAPPRVRGRRPAARPPAPAPAPPPPAPPPPAAQPPAPAAQTPPPAAAPPAPPQPHPPAAPPQSPPPEELLGERPPHP